MHMEGTMDDKERFIGADEACEFLGIKKTTLYSWVNKGIITCFKPTGKKGLLLFKISELESFVKKGRIYNEHTI